MKTALGLVTIMMAMVFLNGCATNFRSPIKSSFAKVPTIYIVQQGSIPAANIYRERFYVIDSTNANSRAFFTPEIVAQIIAGGYQVVTDVSKASAENYYDALKTNYRWRSDIYISGFDKLTGEQIKAIIEIGTQPQFDAQRSPALKK